MKALICAVLSVVAAGMAMYSAYLKRQIDKMIEELSKKEDEGEAVTGCNIPKPAMPMPKAPPRKNGKVGGTQQ